MQILPHVTARRIVHISHASPCFYCCAIARLAPSLARNLRTICREQGSCGLRSLHQIYKDLQSWLWCTKLCGVCVGKFCPDMKKMQAFLWKSQGYRKYKSLNFSKPGTFSQVYSGTGMPKRNATCLLLSNGMYVIVHTYMHIYSNIIYNLQVYFILLPTSSNYSILHLAAAVHVGTYSCSVAHLPQGHSVFQTTP